MKDSDNTISFVKLVEVVQELSKARNINTIASIVRKAARALVGSDGATFVLKDGDKCHYVDEDAIAPLWKGQKFPMSICISGWTMIHRQPAVIENIYADDRIPHDAYRPTFVKSLAMVPIRSSDPIGAIGNYWAQHHQASEGEIQILQALADSTSVAMENVLVYQRLERSEQRYRELVENLEDVVFSLAVDGTVQYISPMVTKFGYSVDEIIGQHFNRFVYKDDRETMLNSFAKALKGEATSCEFRFLSKDAKFYHIRTTIRMGVEDDKPSGFNGVLIDVTEQRKTEDQLKVAQRLESVGRLAGGVAHDYNNILAVQLGYCELMLENLADDDPLAKRLTLIQNCAQRGAVLTRQLLAFSRKQTLQLFVMDLNGVLRNVERMLQRLIGEDIELAMVLRDGLGRVKVDPGQIEQVVMNLAINARDAMPEGGRLTIETANVELDEEYVKEHIGVKAGPHVLLAVSDTGSGIDAETLTHIFEPFFTTKSQGKGTGLGLAMVYGIVKQSEGNIWVYSEVGQGTSFKIYLPCVKEDLTPIIQPKTTKISGTGQLVLVVEDDENLRDLIARILESLKYKIITARSGDEALSFVHEQGIRPQLLITDVIMPGISGRILAERLVEKIAGLKVLFISGYTDNAIVHHGVLDPNVAFLQKPFTKNDLAEKIREVAAGKFPFPVEG